MFERQLKRPLGISHAIKTKNCPFCLQTADDLPEAFALDTSKQGIGGNAAIVEEQFRRVLSLLPDLFQNAADRIPFEPAQIDKEGRNSRRPHLRGAGAGDNRRQIGIVSI